MKLWTIAAAASMCMAAAAPAWADGAGPDDCTGKAAGDACYSYDLKTTGVCVADMMGLLSCQVSGTGGHGGAGGHGGSGGSSAGSGGTGGGDAGGSGGRVVDGAGGAAAGSSGGCSVRMVRAHGGAEAVGLGLLLAACVAVQRRRRDRA